MARRCGAQSRPVLRPLPFALALSFLSFAPLGAEQASGNDHSAHHPGGSQQESGEAAQDAGGAPGMGGGGMGGGMGGKSGPPLELYPQLMSLPHMTPELRASLQERAQERMLDGAARLSKGVGWLAEATPGQDLAAMEKATIEVREGLSQFETGLAARRALEEGQAPRNIALEWFQQDLNLLPRGERKQEFRVFGMSLFHSGLMAILFACAGLATWAYFSRMHRAAELLETLSSSEAAAGAGAEVAPKVAQEAALKNASSQSQGEQCVGEEDAPGRPEISRGLLSVVKKKLCRLRVAKIYQETADVKTFRLVACHGGGIPFSYLPGQFLTVSMPVGDKPIRRSYTISSSPTQGYYCEITVKREEHGAGSRYLHDSVKEGDTLEVQAPHGKFTFVGEEEQSVVLISGGVGITPMMSITRALTDMGWPGDIYFVVACRDPEHLIFLTELEQLAERHTNLKLVLAMSRLEQPIEGYHQGRLTEELLKKEVPNIASRWIHLCGAPPMMEGTKEILGKLGVPADRIHTENFGSQQKPKVRKAENQEKAAASAEEAALRVNFQTSNKSIAFQPGETVLEAAERLDIEIDNSCRVGMCGMCTAKLLSGEVEMEVDDGLQPEDLDAGMILTCQAKPKGDLSVEA